MLMYSAVMKIKPQLAFGVTPSTRRYHLRYAGCKALAQPVAGHVEELGDDTRSLEFLDRGTGIGRTSASLSSEVQIAPLRKYTQEGWRRGRSAYA